MSGPRILTIVLAGGEGKRLSPLTLDRAKPAVPFGGDYRLIDFALSNLVNAGLLRIVVLTQYKSHSLDRHIAMTWPMPPLLGHYVAPVPAQMRKGPHWFSGSADAIFQNLNLIGDEKPDYVVVVGADHIYRMDPRQFVDHHIATGAGVTVAALRVPIEHANQFGVIQTHPDTDQIAEFLEKPEQPQPLADDPAQVFASMGNYVFTTETLIDAVTTDSQTEQSGHDLGGDIIPMLVDRGEAGVYDFTTNVVPGQTGRDAGYWRDVGTLDAYYDSHMDLLSDDPIFRLDNRQWPILTYRDPFPPAKFIFSEEGSTGLAVDSMVSAGVVVSGGDVRQSVLSPAVTVESYASVERSVIMQGTTVGRRAVVHDAIVDKNVTIEIGRAHV